MKSRACSRMMPRCRARCRQAADNAQVEARNQRGREGRLILAVRTTTPDQVSQVTGLMQQAGALRAEPVTRTDQALTAGVSSASWTGE